MAKIYLTKTIIFWTFITVTVVIIINHHTSLLYFLNLLNFSKIKRTPDLFLTAVYL